MNSDFITVIIVCRNEEKHIRECLMSVIDQFDSFSEWELIIVDGQSQDATLPIAKKTLEERYVSYKIIENPGLTLAKGWNIGIGNSKGNYIIRPDAHATLGKNYIKHAVSKLKSDPSIGVVGGRLVTAWKSIQDFVISQALSMRTGVGNSFRTSSQSGVSDTAVYGVYRREVFEKCGLFNENLVRHQDTDFHKRMRDQGFKLYMEASIYSNYFCRDSIGSLANQMYQVGYHFSGLLKEGAGFSLQPRHLVPFAFYGFLVILLLLSFLNQLFFYFFILILSLYLAVIFMEAFMISLKSKSFYSLLTVFVIPVMHICYATGTFMGLISMVIKLK